MDNNETTRKIKAIIGLVVLYLVGPLFFILTDPNKVPIPLLVLPFIWFSAVIFITTRLIISGKTKASNKQGIITASLIAGLIVLLLVFQSIHQLTIKDVLISLAIIGIAAVYLLRADFIK